MQSEQTNINSSLKIGAVFISETLVTIYESKWLRNSEEHQENFRQYENIKCDIIEHFEEIKSGSNLGDYVYTQFRILYLIFFYLKCKNSKIQKL
jgi:hypothetical protein